MLDKINYLRDRGVREIKAIIIGCQSRVRPILITTTTTILGLIPLALDRSLAANLWSPLAVTVSCGLFFSTFLTLLMLPVILFIIEDFKKMFNGLKLRRIK